MRTTEAAVRKIIELEDDFDVAPFIETANMVVTENCTSSGYSDAKLEMIERWLAAHFCAVFDPREKTSTAEGVSSTLEGQSGQGFNFTRYGQQAMLLDTMANLAALNRMPATATKGKIGLIWLGKDPE